MKYGITTRDWEQMFDIFQKFREVESVILFGSRAIGNYKKGSDVDLALKGHTSPTLASRVSSTLNEETNLPYFFDVVDYHSVERKEFLEHIQKYGIEVYKKMA